MAGDGIVRDVILSDGSTLRLRSASAEDFGDIQAFYEGLSEHSRYLRFHGFGRTDAAARDYAEADGEARVALIGRQAGRVVAAAGYDLLREPGAAEVAFTVADDFQGRGTATRLLEQLASIGAAQGLERFDAEVMSDNQSMLAVFKRAGYGLRRQGTFGEVVVSLDIRHDEGVEERIAARDHRAAVASLRAILAPTDIAVVGASSRERGSVGQRVFVNVLTGDFTGVVTPVSRSGGVVRSVRVVESLEALEQAPELVIIATPPDVVLAVAKQAAEKGARALVVLSEGFAETGATGLARQEELLDTVRSAGMRLVGPNSLGVVNTDPAVSLNATVAGARVPPGRLAVCSQSGAIGLGLLGHAAARRLGISSFASLGNRADVSTNDLLEYWAEDESTNAVMLYVQTFGNPERFTRIARSVSRRKPILVIKGRMNEMRDEPRSHTAAARRGDTVVDALLRYAGVLRFHGGDELFNAAQFFESQPLPRGRRVGVVTNSSGLATLAVDACLGRNLTVPEPAAATAERLASHFDSGRPMGNPLNLGIYAETAAYRDALEAMLADNGFDAVMAFYVDLAGGDPSAVLATIDELSAGQDKPVVASVITADGQLAGGDLAVQTGAGVPNFLFPEACASVLCRAAERREWLSRPLGAEPRYPDVDADGARERIATRFAGEAGAGWLTTHEAEALLATHGIPTVISKVCADADAAADAAETLGGPVALKADFPPPGHAGDIDAVLLGLHGASAIRAGWRELERRVEAAGWEWRGAILQPLVSGGADVLVGALSDPDLGGVMALGLGGRQAGLAGDVGFRPVPLTDVDADELLAASPSVARQLDGFRGSPVLDRDALRELILRFAMLLHEAPEIVEADLNPVRTMKSGAIVLDMRLRVEHRQQLEAVKTW